MRRGGEDGGGELTGCPTKHCRKRRVGGGDLRWGFQIEKRGGGTEKKGPGGRRRQPADMAGDERGAGAFRLSEAAAP